ncbi:MAG: hypothetical protein NXH85_03530 [Pseudomonadaceae bacterium]|nr:hypothetical protein [Pseudomonadaceae bacterium]
MFKPPSDAREAERQRRLRLAGTAPLASGNVKLWHVLTIVGGTVATVLIGSMIIEAGYGDEAYAVLCALSRRCS